MKKHLYNLIAPIVVALFVSGMANSAFWQWSTTANNNATADPTINWAEGMSPSSINDSARAMMAALAVNRGTTNGSITVGGTSTAYTMSSGQSFTNAAAMDGAVVSFVATPTSAAGVTLNVDGVGAFPIVSTVSVPVPDGALLNGTIYSATFFNSLSIWKVHNFFGNAFNVPLGGVLWSTLTTPPNANFAAPSGQCISTTTYAVYWAALGSPAPGVCSAGNFQLIDMRGRLVAALDTLNASAAGRLTSSGVGCGTAMTGVGQVCANGTETRTLSVAQLPAHTHANSLNDPGHSHTTNATRLIAGTGLAGGAGNVDTSSVINSSVTGMSITNASVGSGSGVPMVGPIIGLIPYLRIL